MPDNWYWTPLYCNVTHYRKPDKNYRYWGTMTVHPRFVEGYCYDMKTGQTWATFLFTEDEAKARGIDDLTAWGRRWIESHVI